ncbi:hypothetical protein [Arthrobacter sp. B2a2-09]|uniref:hypothetical protein n=1 Tax=Arthrobacter sp. B2a2-09 TaxID=2952822 RepID=UPI0022CD5323|nr:hypothetical protein [Arthrobacter sp. B2a2-09]MCZ9884622.1 hypothetical protein [Arthrobacter sp. B2a2-09]
MPALPILFLSLAALVLVVLKGVGILAMVPLWVCLLPLVPLALVLVLVVLAGILAAIIAAKVTLKAA